jgi:hypothetical protein
MPTLRIFGVASEERFAALTLIEANVAEFDEGEKREFMEYGSVLLSIDTYTCYVQFVHKDTRHCWGHGWVGANLEYGEVLSKAGEALYKRVLGNQCTYLEVDVNEL